jgi:RNA polymerase sigma factor (TIGR02999 family)
MSDETPAPRPTPPPDGPGSSSELLPDVYDDLRRLARARLSREPAGLTLGATALVHEAYLRLVGDGKERQWDRRGHFFAAAAIAMRRILVERARRYSRIRHGGGQHRTSLDVDVPAFSPDLADVVAIDRAVDELERLDPRKAQVVMLRYFAGFTVEETAAAMDLSPATIKSEWAFARAWLYRRLSAEVDRADAVAEDDTANVAADAAGARGAPLDDPGTT